MTIFCGSCGATHRPCDKENCYCGDQASPAVRRGEGYNAKCFASWEAR